MEYLNGDGINETEFLKSYNPDKYKKYALNNRDIIKNYSEEMFISNIRKMFQDILI